MMRWNNHSQGRKPDRHRASRVPNVLALTSVGLAPLLLLGASGATLPADESQVKPPAPIRIEPFGEDNFVRLFCAGWPVRIKASGSDVAELLAEVRKLREEAAKDGFELKNSKASKLAVSLFEEIAYAHLNPVQAEAALNLIARQAG
jgi:hypothetical protein